ncbi:Ig-like domain-containing protein [Clostridium botulinum]|uniref:Cell surface protein n=3 Tax=Clostridium botulinum TaxID=1491 RepID=A0A9Q1UZJ2_CLOBO|nr:Ig-like domain-containing protein [Clostridium botulinum]AEB75641.1 repeat domain protein containing conserved repeat domain TIGRO1451 [Clostridium botulinum BKT015925]KEI01663.1 cell surface protein [Clostridium botulinum D str. 16868]KEI01793.1 cell surface protein [Clostridium botulinum C/D str. Sp77]KLU75591.1 cell surface protein [Clostridium botulinum V891]KOA73163.1 cell surface protein [Clostridium botulinum]
MALESRYNNVINGNIAFIGNTLGLSKATDSQDMGTADAIGAFITTNTGLVVPTYPNGTTLNISENSSSAILNLGTGSEIQFAYLIWGGTYKVPGTDLIDAGTNKIKFTVPNKNTPYNLSADITNFVNPFFTVGLYSHLANVTRYVMPAGNGTYTVSQVVGTTSPSNNVYNCCGWTLVVIYKNPELYDSRYINFYYGIHHISSSTVYETTFRDFETKPAPRANTSRFLVSAMQASANVKGDQVLFGPSSSNLTVLSGPNNPSDNFFGSQINGNNGYIDTSGTFGNRNHNILTATNIPGGRQGWDITNINVDSSVVNSQTEATLKFQSSHDNYYPNAFALVTSIKSPSIVILINVSKYIVGSIGDTFKITMRISNSGEADANYILIKADLPYGLTGVIGSVTVDGVNQGHISIDNGFALVGLKVGEDIVVEALAQVYAKPMKFPDKYVIFGDIYYKFASPSGGDYTGDRYSRQITIYSAPVDISKTSVKKIVNPSGDTVQYTINVTNNSTVNVDNVLLTDLLPSGLSFVSNSVSIDGANSSSDIVTSGVPLGTLTPGQTNKILFTSDVNSAPTTGEEYENFAKISYKANFNSIPYNNEYTSDGYSIYTDAIIIIPTITKTTNKNIVTPGKDTVEYTITITNNASNVNTNAMTNMVLTDILPSGLSYKSGTLTIDSNNSNDSPETGITIPNILAHGASTIIKFTADVNTEPATGVEYVNQSTLNYKFQSPVGEQSNTANSNSNTIYSSAIVIEPTLNLSSNVTSVMLGDTIEYTATIINNTSTIIDNSIFNDILPNGLSFKTGSLTIDGTPNPATSLENDIALGNIQPGNSVIVKYSAEVNSIPNTGSTYPNFFTINYSFNSPAGNLNYIVNSNTNTITINIPVRATVTLAVNKTYVQSIGDEIQYTATITNPNSNINNNPIYDVVLNDILPNGLSYKPGSLTINNVPSSNPISNVSVGTINHGDSSTVEFIAVVKSEPNLGNIYTNSVNVTYKFQSATGENTGNVTSNFVDVYSPSIIIKPTLNLESNKSNVLIKDTINYTATITNNTSTLLENVIFSASLPKGLSYVANSLTINDTPYPSSSINNIPLGAIQPANSIVLKYSATVDSPPNTSSTYSSFFTTNYTFNSPVGNLSTTMNSNTNTITLNLPITATVTLTANKTYVQSIGDEILYTATVTNPSSNINTNPMYDVILKDVLPNGLSYKPGSLTINNIPSSDPLSNVSLGVINHGNSTIVNFTTIVDSEPVSGNSYTNLINITYQYLDANGENANNIGSNSVVTYSPSIIAKPTLILKADKSFVIIGDTINFTATIDNNTSIPINNSIFLTKLPKGLVYIPDSLTINGNPYPSSSIDRDIILGNIQPSNSIILKYSTSVDSHPNINSNYSNFFTINYTFNSPIGILTKTINSNTVTIDTNIFTVNPIALKNIVYQTYKNMSLYEKILASDLGSDSLLYSIKTQPSNGYAAIEQNGFFKYTPKVNFLGTDNFSILLSNSNLGSTIINITILVTDFPSSFYNNINCKK